MLPPGAQHSDEKGAKELVLDDDECPLQIFREWPSDKGKEWFYLSENESYDRVTFYLMLPVVYLSRRRRGVCTARSLPVRSVLLSFLPSSACWMVPWWAPVHRVSLLCGPGADGLSHPGGRPGSRRGWSQLWVRKWGPFCADEMNWVVLGQIFLN